MDKLAFDLDGLCILFSPVNLWRRSRIAALALLGVMALTACGGGGGGQNSGNVSSVVVSQKSAEPFSSSRSSGDNSKSSSQGWVSDSSSSSNRSRIGPLTSRSSSSLSSESSFSSSSSLSSESSVSSSLPRPVSSSSSVAAAIASIEIAPGKVVLGLGASQQLVAVGRLSDKSLANLYGQVSWRIASGEGVASVDANGLLKRLTAGNAEIEAKSQGKTVLLKITSDVENLSLRYDNTEKKWAKVHIYLWTGEGTSKIEPVGKWPGTPMTVETNNLWSHTVSASSLKNGAVSVIFNDGVIVGGGGAAHQTGDLVAKESAVYDGAWKPLTVGETSAQVAVIAGVLQNGGTKFSAGTVLTVNASKPVVDAIFTTWAGASAAYIFTDPTKPQAQVVVPDNVPSVVLQAEFLTAIDPFKAGRNLYASECSSCHGVKGVGGSNRALNNLGNKYTVESLATVISSTMPLNKVGQCIGSVPGTCAYDIANMIVKNKWSATDSCTGENCALDSRNMRLLTTEEYLNSVRDIFAVTIDAAVMSPAVGDAANRKFNTSSSLMLDHSRILGYQMAAEGISKIVIANKSFHNLAGGCGTETKCVVKKLGRKIFRRQMSEEEINRYADLYSAADAGKAVIQGMLISPHFMYRSEKGTLEPATGLYRLTPYEIATLLSYSFWASAPDDILLDAAEGGNLDIASQVNRMLNDKQRAERGLRRFASGWLVDGTYGFSGISPSLINAFQEETIRFTTELISANNPYKALLTADYTYANTELANYYKSAPVASGWAKSVFNDDDARRGTGLLGHASFLASRISGSENPSPIKRGLFVRGILMCQDLPPPQKAGLTIPRQTNDSNREANFRHTSDPGCFSCHQYIDGIGFGFESFGSNGLFRSQETLANGVKHAIDARGTIKSLNSSETQLDPESPEVAYNTLPELANLIANSGQGAACYSRQFYRYIVGRNEGDDDENIIPGYSANLRAGGGMRDMLVDLATNPSFILRRK